MQQVSHDGALLGERPIVQGRVFIGAEMVEEAALTLQVVETAQENVEFKVPRVLREPA